jgi:hypothetical protein
MKGGTETRVIKNRGNRTIAAMEIKDGLLDGKCEWYDGSGGLIAFGFFRKGEPWAGTFISWAPFFPPNATTKPYDIEYYCDDWVTIFESGFDSERPQYAKVLEVYSDGRQIKKPAGAKSGLREQDD